MTLAGSARFATSPGVRIDGPRFEDHAVRVWNRLAPLQAIYPGFRAWYWGLVVPELDGCRRRMIVIDGAHSIKGVAIVKASLDERKLCTLWIAPEARHCGLAYDLFRRSVDWLGIERPLFTVPGERMAEFAGLIDKCGLKPTQRLGSYYRAGSVEHVFNGRLSPSLNG